ncbi:MAG: hypothetical protein HYU32_02060 [candidate division NC10 bacterium]|nr:hypothetical protein [candidate division NC10 bacterium]
MDLVFDVDFDPGLEEEFLDDFGGVLGMGQPEQVQQTQPPLAFQDGGEDGVEDLLEAAGGAPGAAPAPGVRQAGILGPLDRQRAIGGVHQFAEGIAQAGMQLDQQAVALARDELAFGQLGQRAAEELFQLLDRALDEARRQIRPTLEERPHGTSRGGRIQPASPARKKQGTALLFGVKRGPGTRSLPGPSAPCQV